MNEIQKLERIKHFFCALRGRWKLALVSLAAACGGIWLLADMENKDNFWFKIVLVLVLATVVFFLFWFSSLFVVGNVKKKLVEYYTNGVPTSGKSGEKIRFSFSRLLSFTERLQAHIGLKELRDMSNYCFYGGPPSYVRIQWLRPQDLRPDDPKDEVKAWPDNNKKIIYNIAFPEFEGEMTRLWISRRCDENGEHAEAFLTDTSVIETKSEEYQNAVKVPLVLNEPCLLAYEVIVENPDGTQSRVDEPICAITWIGGNG